MVGLTLKKIRKDKNIPIHFICEGIMDSGNYWRLENGEVESSFSTVLKLLERMNVSIEEFSEQLDLGDQLYKTYEKKWVIFFKNKDVESLKQLQQTLSLELKNNKMIKMLHLSYLIDIYITRIDNTWDSQKSKKMLKKYLAQCNNWSSYELQLLNNVLFIYDLNTSFLFYKTAISHFSKKKPQNIVPLTLNMLALCVQRDDKEKARYLLAILQELTIEEKNMYELTIQKWGVAMVNYYLFNHPKHLHEAEKITEVFWQMGMKDTFNLYHSWTKGYKEIIENSREQPS